jgi:AraC-like DNA-binding protein
MTDLNYLTDDTAWTAPSNAAALQQNSPPFERGEREQWHEDIATKFAPVDIASPAQGNHLAGEFKVTTVGSLSVAKMSSFNLDFHRTPANIRRKDDGGVKVSVQLRGGGVVVQRGREAVLNPGDFVVYDVSSPYAMHYAKAFSVLVLKFPRTSLKITSDQLAKVSARRIPGNDGIASLVSQFLVALQPKLLSGTLSTTPMLEDAILDLISAAAIDNTQFVRIPTGATLVASAKSFIEGRLGDPGLDTCAVAAQLHISPRYLQKLFETEGLTVAGWIRSRRLERCRRDLQDTRLLRDSVSAIAAHHGLVNAAHFSRIFKAAYGSSPSDYRKESLGLRVQ